MKYKQFGKIIKIEKGTFGNNHTVIRTKEYIILPKNYFSRFYPKHKAFNDVNYIKVPVKQLRKTSQIKVKYKCPICEVKTIQVKIDLAG